ncbi:hypothetical protein RclHR1_03140012 [Rhizophagus clarus]|uniref:Kinase-like domain-containing protein n=1 Tax=Rhizophagus clarus TaxID=94130 RepID=A0A2Z6R7C4_9GLOM|nr:hypothetical protein RclHR1_03140012 [Rhizophagus clarus]GES99216.1 kinase-like domain-containing protein [Rhizophagus clarus]
MISHLIKIWQSKLSCFITSICINFLNFLHKLKPIEPSVVVLHDCSNCDQCKIDNLPCQPCIREQYQKEYKDWKSCNEKINKLVKYVRPSPVNTNLFLEWIPYEKLKMIEKNFAKGGFGTISLATWEDGYVVRWDHQKNQWHRKGKMQVILKTMNKLENINDNFITELEAYFRCSSPHLINYFGITQDPETNDYAIVMEHAENGDLRNYLTYLQIKGISLFWRRKLDIIRNIVAGLEIIHVTGMMHRDLHIGNILQFKDLLYPSRISDLGLTKQANEIVTKEIIGVLPYIAPEVLDKKPYTKASDIYSLAMILWEVGTEKIPYEDISFNTEFAKNGLRPEIPKEIPNCYADLIKRCWDQDPQKRPTALEIKEKIMGWQSVLGWFPTDASRIDEEAKQFEEADDKKSEKLKKRFIEPPLKPSEISADEIRPNNPIKSHSVPFNL